MKAIDFVIDRIMAILFLPFLFAGLFFHALTKGQEGIKEFLTIK